ncbi:clavesin-2-like isoform X2 [Agrilus planipennis]|nr:clavesin-2-like isoform X2 [Agrilus planipennis]XP_025834682.1 clavesin-2-like isoform X2 [Agrilus planipennis]XP_025834683.1 clavesin-2-like isoform X2 [Agrilus planipennis]XP_025834684.1 clavesin-2-like isoform X2 [Agrilus planipennis]
MGLGGQDCVANENGIPLPEEVRKAALEELREDENIKQQSLDQMKEWINKHPNIKRCRTDNKFLLRFLRTKKFSVPLACEMLERYLIIRQLYPDWFKNLDYEDKDLKEIIDNGYIVPLVDRIDGKLVIFSAADKFDPYKYTAAHMIRVHSLVSEALMDDELNQIYGYVYINDVAGFQMGHISLWSLKDVRNIFHCVQNSSPMRHKANHFINMSPAAAKLIEFGLTFLNDKLRNRTFINPSLDALHEKIDPKILPKEYGGVVPLSELTEKLKTLLKERREQVLSLDDMYIEIDERECKLVSEMNEELGVGLEGSFKKLTVD